MTGFLCLQGRGNYVNLVVKYFCIFVEKLLTVIVAAVMAPDVGLDDVFVLQRLGLI